MEPVGLVAVVLAFSVPPAPIYAWYRVRKLRTEERLAAIAKGVQVPIAEELPPHARSRHAAILLIAGGLGYAVTFMLLSRFDAECRANYCVRPEAGLGARFWSATVTPASA